MRRAHDILKELGFNPEAPEGGRNAFLNHLVKHAADSLARPQASATESVTEENKEANKGEQLSFDPKILNSIAK